MDHNRVTDRILLLVAIVLFVWVLVYKSCTGEGGQSNSDTVYVKGTPDTVIVYDTTAKESIKPDPVRMYVYVHDTIELSNSDKSFINPCDSIRVYTDSIEDGTCKAVITDSIRGELLGSTVTLYSRKMEINRVDTMKITSHPDKWRIGVGAGVSQGLLIYGTASHKRTNFLGGYDFHSKAPFLGVGVMISK